MKERKLEYYEVGLRGHEVPFIVSSPGNPETRANPVESETRLSWGTGKVRNAYVIWLEGDPIISTIKVEKGGKFTMVDVEFPCFHSFLVAEDIKEQLQGAGWWIPSPLVNEIAAYAKKITDAQRNEKAWSTKEKDLRDANDHYQKLLLGRDTDQLQREMEKRYNPEKAKTRKEQLGFLEYVLIGLVIGLVVGFFLF
jgi:hypothetical protein